MMSKTWNDNLKCVASLWKEKFGFTFGETSGGDIGGKRLNFVEDISELNIWNKMGYPHPPEEEKGATRWLESDLAELATPVMLTC